MDPGRRLRRLIGVEQPLVCLGVFDGHSARLAELSGAKALYAGGFAASAVHGLPDEGLLTRDDRTRQLASITRATALPVIADADTGWGGPGDVAATVRAFEAVGVAGIQIEDQVCAKRCGQLGGKQVIGSQEMVAKIAAASAARRDPGLMIFARTDALEPLGLANALARSEAYADAGADALLVDAPASIAEVEEIGRRLRAIGISLVYNAAPTGNGARATREVLARLGYGIVLHPVEALLAAHEAMADAMCDVFAGRASIADTNGDRFRKVSRFLARGD